MKAKKCIKVSLVAVIAVALLAMSFGFIVSTSEDVAYASEEEASVFDSVLLDTVRTLFGGSYSAVTLNARPLYDLELNALGYSYGMSINGVNGYAIVIDDGDGVKVSELAFDAADPYATVEGTPVYVSETVYADYSDGEYAIGDDTYTSSEIMEANPTYYTAGSRSTTYGSYSVTYASKNVAVHDLAATIPCYYDTSASIAAAAVNVIAYYDRTCTNLISGYTPGENTSAGYNYNGRNATLNSLYSQMSSSMSNSDAINHSLFRNALTSYASAAGYTATFSVAKMSLGLINKDAVKTYLGMGRPVVVFTYAFQSESVSEGSNVDTYATTYTEAQTALVAFGYKEVTYTLSNGSTSVSTFMRVATGRTSSQSTFVNLDNNLYPLEALAVGIS